MEISKKLQLKKPQISDDIQQTIEWLSQNFDIIDMNFDETISDITAFLTTGELYDSGRKFWNRIPSLGGFAGWTNIRTGVFAPIWKRQTTYNAGDLVIMGKNDGHYYRCIVGGTSGVNEPFFSLGEDSITEDLNGATIWTANYNYKIDDIVVAKNGDKSFYYKCIQTGTSGNIEPNWINISGTTIIDGSIVWYTYKTVQWREQGNSCEFVPFGVVSKEMPTKKYAKNIGDGTSKSFIINHNLNTKDVVVMVYESTAPYSKIDVGIKLNDNSINIDFTNTPTVDQYRVVVVG